MRADGRKRVLIAGGGVAALEAMLGLHELAADLVEIELLAPHETFVYQPMSVAEPFGVGTAVHLDLDDVSERLGAHRIPAGLTGIDAWRQVAHTTRNTELPYDVLLIACGALPLLAVPGAVPFRGSVDTVTIGRLLGEVSAGDVRSIAFVIPWGAVWSLPAYELALLTHAVVQEHGISDVELWLVTPEADPVQVFGQPASDAVRRLLSAGGISLRTGAYAGSYANGSLELVPGPPLEVDRVVALPRLEGPPIDGIPQTLSGFVSVDAHGRVHGLSNVYAAGDITSFPVKQGGLAAQQAEAAAEAIAAAAGADVEPRPFRPVLRGLLLTGREPRYLRRELSGSPEHEPIAGYEPLWWPPAKIVGRRLAPFLAAAAGLDAPSEPPPGDAGTVSVEVALDPATAQVSTAPRIPPDIEGATDEVEVAELMVEPLVVAPDDTLADVAEQLTTRALTAAAVAESGRLIGIVTASDVVRASAARVQPAEAHARMWMTAEPVTVPPHYPVTAAAMLMAEYGIHHLLVVDDERVVGTVAVEDLCRAGIEAGVAEASTR
jgi:sulfide:quinone oxidoreductase